MKQWKRKCKGGIKKEGKRCERKEGLERRRLGGCKDTKENKNYWMGLIKKNNYFYALSNVNY